MRWVSIDTKHLMFLTIGCIVFGGLSISTIPLARVVIQGNAAPYVHEDVADLPNCKTGLVLGCSKYTPQGTINLYFKYRIQKAAELYHSGKVEYLIVSGDNHKKSYDEPTDMMNALIELGVPENRIYCDYAGFSTLDSVVRANKIFGQKKLIVVSQDFHNLRAVFIGRCKGMELHGLNAKSVYVTYSRMTLVREALARVKTLLDVWIIHRKPRFLGEAIQVG
jgi:SanA protein